jgi:cell division GTPase FtsZ
MAVTDHREATDTRHRVPYPNSRPRLVKLVGVGTQGGAIADAIGRQDMPHVKVVTTPPLTAGAAVPRVDAAGGELVRSLAAGADGLARALAGADMIFVVVGSDDDASYAVAIGRYGREHGVLVTGVIIDTESDRRRAGDRSLDEMRRACDMLVITSDADYLAGMLAALGS